MSGAQAAEAVEVVGVLSRAAPCRLIPVLRRDSGNSTEVVNMTPLHLMLDVKLALL